MLMKIGPPTMSGSFVMSTALISPSRREVSLTESLRRRAKVLLPRFRLETAVLHPKTFLLIFLGQMASYSIRWAPEAFQVPHKSEGARPQACGCLVGPPLMFLFPIFFIYSKIILYQFSCHLELWRIGAYDIALSNQEFQLLTISLFMWILQNKREKA